MKNLLQKALAVWLSVVTVLSVSVPALASDGAKVGSGSVSGRVFSHEGPMPGNVIDIQMPTEPQGAFDFIIDPSGAIMSSGGARYKSQFGDDVTFDNGKLFFRNVTTDENGETHISYSNRSDSFVVKNLSNVPVDVKMTLEVEKGGYDFDFAAHPDFTNESGSTIDGPSMYMALVTAKREGVVKTESVEEDGQTVVKNHAVVHSWLAPPEDAFHIVWDGENNDYRYQLKPDLPDSLFDRTSFYVTGALGDGVWDDIEGLITLNVAWEVVATESEELENPFDVPGSEPALQSITYAYNDGETAKIVVDFGSGDDAMTAISGIHYTMEDGTTGFVSADEMTISPYPANEFQSLLELTVSGDLFEAVSWSLELSADDGYTVELPLELVQDVTTPIATVITRAAAAGESAQIRVNWGAMTQISGITYTTNDGNDAEIPADAITLDKECDGIGSQSMVSVTLDESAITGSDFTLLLTNDDEETAEFVLDLSSYSVDPTVTAVTGKANASTPASTVTVTWGAGSKKMNAVKEVNYTKPDGSTGKITDEENFSIDGSEITIRFDENSIRGRNFELVLANTSKNTTFTIPLNEELVEPSDPTVTVTQTATADTPAIMTIDWGTGTKAMSSVQKVTYDTGEIFGDENITVSGNTVSVKFDGDAINGHDFKVILTNAFGETFETPTLDLVADCPASVLSTQKASAVGEFAAITVDWGAGASSMSDVSGITYLNASGHRVPVDSSDITVIGNTISVRLNDASVMGTDFQLTLKNYLNNPGSAIDVDLVNAVDPDVTASSKASASGESATITVNWGSGAKAMSSVQKATYTNVSGQAAEIPGSAITVDGNTITVPFDQASIRGKDFKLVLTRNGGATFPINVDLVNASDPAVTVATKASASGESATMTVDWGTGSSAMSGVSKVTYTDVSSQAAQIIGSPNITVSGNTVSVKFDDDSIRGTNFKVVLTNGTTDKALDDVLDLVNASDPTATVTRKASASGESATITVNWDAGASAMSGVSEVKYTNVSNASASIANATVSGNTITVPFDETSIKGTNFQLVLNRNGGATKTLDVDLVNASDPTVTVNSKATGAGETSTATVNWGTGSKAMSSVSRLTYTTIAGAAAQITNFTVSGNTITVPFDATSIKGSNFKLILTKASGETFEAAVDLANYEEPPTATATRKATTPGQSAIITVNWGVGSRAMSSASKVTYTDANGAAAEITSENITTSGSTVSVKFDRKSIQGSNFKLILANAAGATWTSDTLDLAEFDSSAGFGAEATVTQQATSGLKSAKVVVDWGTGEAAMTSVVKVTYQKSNGSSAEILPGTYLTVDGDIVTVNFTLATLKGKNFVLVLKNDSGATLEIPVDLIAAIQ